MTILSETLHRVSAHRPGPRITDVRLGGYFTLIRLDDGSVGAAMSYYRRNQSALEHTQAELARAAVADRLLLAWMAAQPPGDLVALAVRAAVAAALSAPVLAPGDYADYRASLEPPFDPMSGGHRAVVVGFGGYMERLARDRRVQQLHVADLGYGVRRAEMDDVLDRYRRARPELRVTVSDGHDTAIRMRDADIAFITGSALCNDTMEPLLDWARRCAVVVVQGQSAAICPGALLSRGVDLVITTVKPHDLIEIADAGRLRDALEGGLPPTFLSRPSAADRADVGDDEPWFQRYAHLFAENGYRRPPRDIYRAFRTVIDRPGSLLELGCGNGLLVRYLADHSPGALDVSGVDTNEALIDRARRAVCPERCEYFAVADVRDPDRQLGVHTFVIANPLYADPGYYDQRDGLIQRLHADGSIAAFVRRCSGAIQPGGRLVLFCYEGQLREVGPWREAFERELGVVPLTEVTPPGGGVTFFIGDKPSA